MGDRGHRTSNSNPGSVDAWYGHLITYGLLSLLVLAIRHGDRVALSMDARAFGSGPRSRYREVHWTALDVVVGAAAVVALFAALMT